MPSLKVKLVTAEDIVVLSIRYYRKKIIELQKNVLSDFHETTTATICNGFVCTDAF